MSLNWIKLSVQSMTMRKKIILTILVGCISFFLWIAFLFVKTMQDSKDIIIQDVDMNHIADGTYQGACSLSLVEVEVELVVQNHKIIAMRLLKHEQGMGSKAEVIVDHILHQNTISVDVITSATISSKAIMKASENALVKK